MKLKLWTIIYGKIVKNLIDEGAKLGVSSRGMGSLENKGGSNYVGRDFYLATAGQHSCRSICVQITFVQGIMEGKEWVWDNGVIREVDIHEMKKTIERAKRIELAEKNG